MEDLATRVQDLPVELYNDILDLMLTPDAKFVTIKDDYEPPTQLQISRATRERFAVRYYSPPIAFAYYSTLWLCRWLKSLPKEHCSNIARIFQLYFSRVAKPEAVVRDEQVSNASETNRRLQEHNIVLSTEAVVAYRVYVRETNGSRKREMRSYLLRRQDR